MLTFYVLGAHDPVRAFPAVVSPSVMAGVGAATIYLALEPWVRRFWPQTMVTWSRFVIGRWRDPLVARDILLGVTAATINHVVQRSLVAGATALGAAPLGPIDVNGQFGFVLENLGGQLIAVSVTGYVLWRAITAAVSFFFILLVLKRLLRRTSLAALALFFCLGGLYSVPWFAAGDAMIGVLWLVEASFLVTVMLRWGLFAAVAFVFPSILINFSVLTPAMGAWYGQSSALACATIVAIATWAFWTSSRQPALGSAAPRHW
jgi:serine/threonine-protein kinase